MKSTYVDTRSANVGDIRCLFALASDSTINDHLKLSRKKGACPFFDRCG